MAGYFHHNTIRKYTLGLLDTFNNLQVERTLTNDKGYVNVPITFGSKDKAFVMTETDVEQWKTGNYNVLPRMSLSLLTINKDQKRDLNKLHTINKTVNGKTLTFQYNAVSYVFTYELAIATRSMTELTMLLEQILPHFNPTYNLLIKEMDIQEEPTLVPVSLMSTDIDLPTNTSQDDIRICSAMLILDVRGNVYQPFTDTDMIESVRMYMNMNTDEEQRSIKYEFDVDDTNTLKVTDYDNMGTVNSNPPVLSEIQGLTNILQGTHNYTAIFTDVDDEKDFIYLWNILPSSVGTATVTNSNPTILNALTSGSLDLMCQVVDRSGNISNSLVINIIIE